MGNSGYDTTTLGFLSLASPPQTRGVIMGTQLFNSKSVRQFESWKLEVSKELVTESGWSNPT